MQEVIYLDYNATAPMLPAVKDAIVELAGRALNPSSIHSSGRFARKIMEEARGKILKSVNAKNLVFCGSASEANNFALAQSAGLLISAIEHESIYKSAADSVTIPVNTSGIIDLEALKKLLSQTATKNPQLISVMLANNETGIIQPIKQVVEIAKEYNANNNILVHTDAVQAYGRIEIDFADLGVDLMTVSSHKAGGPVGSAAFIYKNGIELKPFIKGGGQEKNKRAGTENIAAIHGFGVFAEKYQMPDAAFQNYLEEELQKLGCEVVGKNEERLPNTSCIIHPSIPASTMLMHLDSNNICVSSGSACSSGKVETSRVLQMLKVTNAQNAIRVSTGWGTTKKEIQTFIQTLDCIS